MRHGAEARFGATVAGWEVAAGGACELALADGSRVRAGRLIVCAGAWLESLFPGRWPVRIERNVQHWFASDARARPETFPIFMLERAGLPQMFYGFPDFGDGLKAAFHGSGRFVAHPSRLEREVAPAEVAQARRALDSWCPGLAREHLASTACTYALTPDGHFILGALPGLPVLVAAGFSGHGFKFAPLVGEVLADLALAGSTAHSLDLFDPARFG
jgi:sarcosine oxidase